MCYVEIQAHGCLIAAINAHSWALRGERDSPAVGRDSEFEEDPLFRFSSSLFFPLTMDIPLVFPLNDG